MGVLLLNSAGRLETSCLVPQLTTLLGFSEHLPVFWKIVGILVWLLVALDSNCLQFAFLGLNLWAPAASVSFLLKSSPNNILDSCRTFLPRDLCSLTRRLRRRSLLSSSFWLCAVVRRAKTSSFSSCSLSSPTFWACLSSDQSVCRLH